jgi:phage regulator Rha-like protein
MDNGLIVRNTIKEKIHTIRGKQIILDSDIANFYGIETKKLNQAVKRNKDRFPERYMFQLNYNEFEYLRSQNVTANSNITKKRFFPYAFTEQGVSMLSSILKNKKAAIISIQIIDAFVAMRHFLLENKGVFQKFQQIDQKLIEHDGNFNTIFKAIESKQLTPNQGIFYDNQIYDAFKFTVDLIKQANREIILIDNYIDESVLTLLSNKNKDVNITIYTANVSEKLTLAKNKFNKQYGNLEIKQFNKSHDRFLIIDKQTYHIGASLKDVGKRWFAFSKINIDIVGKIK